MKLTTPTFRTEPKPLDHVTGHSALQQARLAILRFSQMSGSCDTCRRQGACLVSKAPERLTQVMATPLATGSLFCMVQL